MPMLGTQIGKKFHRDGSVAVYRGNTVLSDVCPGNPAYETMSRCRQMVADAGLDGLFILMPQDSYHMTVIRALNDLVRTEAYWPAALPMTASMAQADAYVQRAVNSVVTPDALWMRFDGARINEEDFRICLSPADEAQNARVRAYRDAVAEALGLFLPGHAEYAFHITLAYTLFTPQEAQAEKLRELETAMNELLAAQPPFEAGAPHAAYYQDMLAFFPDRIARES